MLIYILRRLLQLVPILFGVLVLTFILFNVAGGSPAALMLGKNVSARQLEEFDEQRGFNKPLFFGWWTSTRAYETRRDTPFPLAWRTVEGARLEDDRVRIEQAAEVPMAFAPRAGLVLRWSLRYRTEGRYRLAWTDAAGPHQHDLPPALDEGLFSVTIRSGGEGQEGRLRFEPLSDHEPPLEILRLTLERRMTSPWDSQFVHFLGRLFRLDFGESMATGQPVLQMMREGIGPSLLLMVPIFFGELLLAVTLALFCAWFRNRWPDRLIVVASVLLMSVNYLVWIVMGQYWLAFRWNWFPVWGFESWRHLLLPWLIGLFSGLGGSVRFYRTVMLDEMYRDYVRTAFAKGLPLHAVLFRHVLRNAMIPIITQSVMALPFLYTGSLLLESFFGIPGLGYLSVNALNSLDVDVVRAVVVIGTVLYVLANLVSDLCYALVDPRVRLK